MTKTRLSHFLDHEFHKWSVEEDASRGLIRIKFQGSFILGSMVILNHMVPMGVTLKFYTMGFWESLFTKNGSWRTK